MPGRTVLLTTHYMAEADELCDRIAIVDHGRILALGTPGRAQAKRVQRESVFRLELDRLDGGPAALRRLPGVAQRRRGRRAGRRRERQTIEINLALEDDGALGEVVGTLAATAARTSSPCASPSPRSRTCSSSSSGAGFEESEDSPRSRRRRTR